MEIHQEKLLEKTESFFNIILNELGEKNYREYIKSNPLLQEYDNLMNEFEKIPYDLLEKVYQIVKNKVKTL